MSTAWRQIGDTTFQAFVDFLKDSPLAPFAFKMYYSGQPHTKLLLAQLDIESNLGTSALFQNTNNPLGLRPRPDDDGPSLNNFRKFANPVEAVQYWYHKLTDPLYAYANTTTLEEYVHTYAPASDGNNEANYVASIAAIVGRLPDNKGGPVNKPVGVPVLKNLYLGCNNQNNPCTKLPHDGQLYIVWHETGDTRPGATAAAEIAYIQSQEARNRQASYHASVDDHQIVQGMPFDRIAYHAGDGCDDPSVDIGCYRSIAFEICVYDGIDKMASRRNAAEFVARVCAGDDAFDWGDGHTKGRFDINHNKMHIQVSDPGPNQHHCPDTILNDNAWNTVMGYVDDAWALWNPLAQKPAFPAHRVPVKGKESQGHILTINHLDRFRCSHGTSGRTAPNRAAPAVVALHKGSVYTFAYTAVVEHEHWFVSKMGTWAVASAFSVVD